MATFILILNSAFELLSRMSDACLTGFPLTFATACPDCVPGMSGRESLELRMPWLEAAIEGAETCSSSSLLSVSSISCRVPLPVVAGVVLLRGGS